MTTKSDQTIARIIREEIRERVYTVSMLLDLAESAENDSTQDQAPSHLSERLLTADMEINELIEEHMYYSDNILLLSIALMHSYAYELDDEDISDLNSTSYPPMKLVEYIESKYNLSTKEASEMVRDISDVCKMDLVGPAE